MLNTVISTLDIKKLDDVNKEKKKELLVICPNCGAQFLPGEIYMPEAFIGHPVEVVRDSFGMLVYADYKKIDNMPNRTERFICEYCDKPFEVEASPMVFRTKEVAPEEDFSTDYVPLL